MWSLRFLLVLASCVGTLVLIGCGTKDTHTPDCSDPSVCTTDPNGGNKPQKDASADTNTDVDTDAQADGDPDALGDGDPDAISDPDADSGDDDPGTDLGTEDV